MNWYKISQRVINHAYPSSGHHGYLGMGHREQDIGKGDLYVWTWDGDNITAAKYDEAKHGGVGGFGHSTPELDNVTTNSRLCSGRYTSSDKTCSISCRWDISQEMIFKLMETFGDDTIFHNFSAQEWQPDRTDQYAGKI
jgi:hypothetical protein